jgi:hypothetical protein
MQDNVMPVGIVLQLFRLVCFASPSHQNVRGEAFHCVSQVSIRPPDNGMLHPVCRVCN